MKKESNPRDQLYLPGALLGGDRNDVSLHTAKDMREDKAMHGFCSQTGTCCQHGGLLMWYTWQHAGVAMKKSCKLPPE